MSHFFHHMSRSRNDLHKDPNPETPLRKWNPVMTRLLIQPERLPILTCQSRKSGRTTAIRKREGRSSGLVSAQNKCDFWHIKEVSGGISCLCLPFSSSFALRLPVYYEVGKLKPGYHPPVASRTTLRGAAILQKSCSENYQSYSFRKKVISSSVSASFHPSSAMDNGKNWTVFEGDEEDSATLPEICLDDFQPTISCIKQGRGQP
ncbi:hypothetical protein D5086_030420 [Populus alba]|uniref:Uncharacterized protein n=1 Tax=Populus alba TaxID=43335 RepID=A0ACC4AP34_POPAL